MQVTVTKCDLCGLEITEDSPSTSLPISVSFALKNDSMKIITSEPIVGTMSFQLPPEVVDVHYTCAHVLIRAALSNKASLYLKA